MQKRLKLIVITILVMFMSIAITNSKVEAATVSTMIGWAVLFVVWL